MVPSSIYKFINLSTMKIKVKLFEGGKMPLVNENGDLFDVYAREDVAIAAPWVGTRKQVDKNRIRNVEFNNALIGLGIAMEIPKGFKANMYPRSSTYKKWGIVFSNSVGQIDNSYRGDNDEWKISAIALKDAVIKEGDRVAQFEIVPSSKATIWQKLKWLFSSKIEFVQVDSLNNESRGGFGSTGHN